MRRTIEHQSTFVSEAPWSSGMITGGNPVLCIVTSDDTVVASAASLPNSLGRYEAGFVCDSEGVYVAEWRATHPDGIPLRSREPFNVIRTRAGEV